MTRRTEKIVPTNLTSCFVGGLHLRALRTSLGATEPFVTERVEGFIILAALEREDGSTELYYHDDDDTFVTIDEGKPYEVYVRMITNTVYMPYISGYVPTHCPVTGERWEVPEEAYKED